MSRKQRASRNAKYWRPDAALVASPPAARVAEPPPAFPIGRPPTGLDGLDPELRDVARRALREAATTAPGWRSEYVANRLRIRGRTRARALLEEALLAMESRIYPPLTRHAFYGRGVPFDWYLTDEGARVAERLARGES